MGDSLNRKFITDLCMDQEQDLVDRCKRELVNGKQKEPIENLRLQCHIRGPTGLLLISKALREESSCVPQHIDFTQFANTIRNLNFRMTDTELHTIFTECEDKSTKSLDLRLFMNNLCPKMPERSYEILEQAYSKIDTDGTGVITLDTLKKSYCVKNHPKYGTGEITERILKNDFGQRFQLGFSQSDETITREEFINFYASLSRALENDGYFDLLIRRDFQL